MGNKRLEEYDNERFGPILGVSDEGSAVKTIVAAGYESAKAQALGDRANDMCIGLIVDGERMGSAGEVPIGPPEYADVLSATAGRTFCTTNVGVRVNTRVYQPLPEFAVSDAKADVESWLASIFERFRPFIDTPDGQPRPLTIRLLTRSKPCVEALRTLVPRIEAGRADGRLGPSHLHRLSFLLEFDNEIDDIDVEHIRKIMKVAAELNVPEVAVDGRLVEAARRRISIQGLLNVLSLDTTRTLLSEGEGLGVRLVYHYETDQETAARTVWTGLDSAQKNGLTAAKYGLFPLTFDQQRYVVNHIQRWMSENWTAIPAFYVDTAIVTNNDVYDSTRILESCSMWLDMISEEGVKVALIDCPDRITPHRLLQTGEEADRGLLTFDIVEQLSRHAEKRDVKALWSGGIRPHQAYELGKLGVAGIFTTGSTAHPVAVHGTMLTDIQLARQAEPTGPGVRRIHALVGGGYLHRVLDDESVRKRIDDKAAVLLDRGIDNLDAALDDFNATLVEAWKAHWNNLG